MTVICFAIQIARSSEHVTGGCSRWGSRCTCCWIESTGNNGDCSLHCCHQKRMLWLGQDRYGGRRPRRQRVENARTPVRIARAREGRQKQRRGSEIRNRRASENKLQTLNYLRRPARSRTRAGLSNATRI